VIVGNSTADTSVNANTYLDLTVSGGNGIRMSSYNVNKYGSIGYLGSAGAFWNALWLQPVNATSVAGTIRAQAAQSANLFEWQDSAGTVKTAIAADGDIVSTEQISIGNLTPLSSVRLSVYTNTDVKGLVIRGSGSQTANLQEWQTSAGTVLTSIGSTGNVTVASTNGSVNVGTSQAGYISIGTQANYSSTFNNTATMCMNTVCLQGNGGGGLTVSNQTGGISTGTISTNTFSGNNIASRSNGVVAMQIAEYVSNTKAHVGFNIASTSTAAALFSTSGTGTTNLAVRAIASQTANLQEWQDSTGTSLARVNASGQLTATGLVSTQSGSANDLYFNRSDTGAVRIKSNWGGATAYGVQIQPSAGSVTSYASGYGVLIGNAFSSSVTSGNYDILRVYDNAFNPTSGNSQLSGININPIINQTGTATGITRGLYVNPTLTSAVDFRGVEIANASGYGLYQSGASAVNYLAGVTKIGSNGTAGTVEKFRVNTPTTIDNLAATILSTGATTTKGLVIQGVASQSANLQEWQSSTGTVLASISSAGNLTVVNATVNGTLVVNGASTFNGNITVNGQIITGNASGSTTVTVDTAGAGTGASASISGNDTSGVITINTGTGAAAGKLATITFSAAFPSSPNVVITPKAIPGGGAYPQYHYDSATGTFDLSSFNALTDSSTYTFSYFIVD
ncbi:hypothetical protein KA047_03015, partial [Candidatus Saccharibacteria bacterium]|nr:hypothetical protein [Candidatus Saccharibacteria bacterium]